MTTRFAALFLLMVIFAYFPIRPAYADCSGPEGVEGEQIYNKTHQTMQFCDGSVWWSMKSGGIVALTNLGECADGHPLVFDEENGNLRCDISPPSPSQPSGSLDTTFNPGSGANNTVLAMTLQPDGKILLGGQFASYNGTARNRIIRLNADGGLDTSFDPGSGADSTVYSVVLQPDGKILIGGGFYYYNGTYRPRIARLNTDGSLDTTFNLGSGANNNVNAMVLQPDGKILIGGNFTTYDGTARNRIARLNTDGSLDITFNPGSGVNGSVESLALQPDGKILIGGTFNNYNNTGRDNIARINANGSLDISFEPGSGASSSVSTIALQPDGKILISGNFSSYNDTARNRIARLNADGGLDTSFTPSSGANNSVRAMAQQPDGKILIGGTFTNYDDVVKVRVARLNDDGSLDTSFDPGNGADNAVYTFAVQPDGKILIGGAFTNYDDKGRARIARINP